MAIVIIRRRRIVAPRVWVIGSYEAVAYDDDAADAEPFDCDPDLATEAY